MKFVLLILVLLVSFGLQASPEKNNQHCDPVVVLEASSTTLLKALTQLANQHGFKLAFPVSVDKKIESPGSMPLSKMLKYLTAGMNSLAYTKTIKGCEIRQIIEMEILPVGETTEYVYVEQKPDAMRAKRGSGNRATLVIDDMDRYAEEVLLNQRESKRFKMTAKQRKLFKTAKLFARKRLIEQGLLERKGKKNKDKLR